MIKININKISNKIIEKIENQELKKSYRMKIDHRRKVHKKQTNNNMTIGSQNHCAASNLATSNSKGGGTDFSIAAIMARGGSSREPSERSISKINIVLDIERRKIFE